MIFVTVGSDIPFDRLIRAVDQWARENERRDVFAQIGRGGWEPEFIPFAHMLNPAEFRERLSEARAIVAHAGMGTILSALQSCKPILVMPRRGPLGETRNDHQMDTARELLARGKINVAFDENELSACLDRLDELSAQAAIPPFAGPELVGALHAFIHQDRRP
jgi:UDP-N-acetylglucosamine transferase subunit ALG13